MALLGSTVDPRLFVQDYSGFTRAADIQAQSMANLGGQIAGGIERYGEQKQERKKLDAGIKATVTGIESAIKMGKSLGIDVESSLTPYLEKINDPNVSPVEAAAYAQQASNSISNVLNFGMKANEMGIEKERYKQATAARIAELQAEANKPVEMKLDKFVVGETEVDVLTDKFGNMYDPQSRSKIVDIPGYAAGKPLEQVTEKGASLGPSFSNFPAPYYPAPVGDSVNNGSVLPSLGNTAVPQLSAEQQAVMDAEGAAYPDGIPIAGTPLIEGATPTAAGRPIEERVAELVETAPTPTPQLANADAIQSAANLTAQPPVTSFVPRGKAVVKDEYRDFTLEEIAKYGSPGQVNLKNKSVKLLPAPSGMSWKVSPDGTVEVIQGSGIGGSAAKAEAAKEAQKEQSFERSRGIIGAAADLINMIKSDLSQNPVIAKAQQGLSIVLPASTEGRIAKNLETVKILNSKEAVNQARAASPTGSAGGNITENEWKIFQNNFGTLEVGMYPPDLASNLQKTSLNQFEAVNGRPEDVIKLFNNGKITKPVFDEYIKEYKQTRSILGIADTGTGGPGDDWTKYNPSLLRFDKEKQSQLSPEAQSLQDKLDTLKANQ